MTARHRSPVSRRAVLGVAAVLLAGCRATPPAKPIVVEVYADMVCPWCFVGTERLDQAVAQSGLGQRVVVQHKTFLLSPDTPDEGVDVAQMLREKTGREPAELFARVEAFAKESGLPLDLSKQPRQYPTVKGHALLRHAAAKGTQRALEQALFRANFLDGKNISDEATLIGLAAPHGFTADEVKRIVNDPQELAAVRTEAQAASRAGITGVPFFVFPDGQRLSGAQPVETLRQALLASSNPGGTP